MGWFRTASDTDLEQGMKLATDAAREARQTGDQQREAAFHHDLNNMLDEAQRRGWKKNRR